MEIVGGDFVASNIENFIGLEQLSTIGGGLYITAVGSCEGLSGLQSLNTIEAEEVSSFKGLNRDCRKKNKNFITNWLPM